MTAQATPAGRLQAYFEIVLTQTADALKSADLDVIYALGELAGEELQASCGSCGSCSVLPFEPCILVLVYKAKLQLQLVADGDAFHVHSGTCKRHHLLLPSGVRFFLGCTQSASRWTNSILCWIACSSRQMVGALAG